MDVGTVTSSAEAQEKAWRIHAAIGDWTARVDAKASFALTLQSAAMAGIVALSGTGHRLGQVHGFSRIFLWLGALLILAGAALAILVVVPRLRAGKVLTEAPQSYVYFGHLQHWNAADLALALENEDILPVLSKQLVMTSKIAWDKHLLVQRSFAISGLGGLIVFLIGVFA
jgi:hypothetical protein